MKKILNKLINVCMSFILSMAMVGSMFFDMHTVSASDTSAKYTLQVYLNFETVDKDSGGSLRFINTSSELENESYEHTHSLENYGTFSKYKNNLPQNEDWGMSYYDVGLKEDGSLQTVTTFVPLFMDQQTSYSAKPSIEYMSPLQNLNNSMAGYTLSKIYVYQPKKDDPNWDADKKYIDTTKLASNDFVVYNVPLSGKGPYHQTEKILFTDDTNDTTLTIPGTEDKYYSNLATYTTEESGLKYVKESTAADGTYTILIQKGTVIRLVYDIVVGDLKVNANFFDYDISEGTNYETGTIGFPGRGINIHSNYVGRGGSVKYAFGNANTGTGLGKTQFLSACNNGYGYLTFNSYNNCNRYGLTYDLVEGLKYGTDGLPVPVWNSKVSAPDLFSSKNIPGKTAYVKTGKKNSTYYNLVFKRNGGTVILSSVQQNKVDSKGKVATTTSITNLDKFRNTYVDKEGNPIGKTIYGNSFWPMDTAPSAGTKGHDPLFGDTDKPINITSDVETEKNNSLSEFNFPPSDDSLNHNSYFGMSYSIDFRLMPGYIAPLNYWFYGDDDMWVFLQKLDTKGNPVGEASLIADIGGVHSSTGIYVNLWDWMKPVTYYDANGKENKPEDYRITVFYTERGASGSSSYMSFKLPTGFDSIQNNSTNTPVVSVPNTGDTIGYQFALLIISLSIITAICLYHKHKLNA